jgi:cyclic beta-1,2-glucan synthetase
MPAWIAAPFAVLWLLSPALARWSACRPPVGRPAAALGRRRRAAPRRPPHLALLRDLRDGEDNWLPPDNFQEDPRRSSRTGRRRRTSGCTCWRPSAPATSAGSGRSRWWSARGDARDHAAPRALPRPLLQLVRHARPAPARAAYVSSVDSGNLAAHLLALREWRHRNACRARRPRRRPRAAAGWRSTRWPATHSRPFAASDRAAPARPRRACCRQRQTRSPLSRAHDGTLLTGQSHVRATTCSPREARARQRLPVRGAGCCRSLSAPKGELLRPAGVRGRLASFFAIATGWFRLGRAGHAVGHGAALISWSGSMFEYLMPSLVMRAPAGSLLEQTSRWSCAGRSPMAPPWGCRGASRNPPTTRATWR